MATKKPTEETPVEEGENTPEVPEVDVAALAASVAELSKAVAAANARAEAAEAKAAQAALGMGNDLRKLSAFKMPPDSSHIVGGTTSQLPSGNTIVNA